MSRRRRAGHVHEQLATCPADNRLSTKERVGMPLMMMRGTATASAMFMPKSMTFMITVQHGGDDAAAARASPSRGRACRP